jgi:hypothetical protein
MEDLVEEYGRFAGKIWQALNEYGALSVDKLLRETGLRQGELYTGVGWLARENKIYREETVYRLGESNLADEIGENAGKVWKALDSWEDIDEPYISKLAGISEQDVFLALGWLAREGKLWAKRVKVLERYSIKFALR